MGWCRIALSPRDVSWWDSPCCHASRIEDIPEIYNILRKGTEKARETAAQTMAEVREAMRINYFDDAELIRSQAEKFKSL